MLSSYHTHIAESGLDNMVMAAAAHRMPVLGISERMDRLWRPEQLEQYRAQVRFAAAPGLRLRMGVELDFLPDAVHAMETLLTREQWDFALGGVHQVAGTPLHRLAFGDLGQSWGVWRAYCEAQARAVRSGLLDVLAHPLRLARHLAPPPYLEQLLLPLLEAAREMGVAMEIHGGDWGQRTVLHGRLITWAHASGVRVCLGAGAHRPQDVAQHLPDVAAALHRAGYLSVTGFVGRRAVAEALPQSPSRFGGNWATGMR